MAQSRLQTERIDVASFTVKGFSYNIQGHEDRMKNHCERIKKEYHGNLERIKKANILLYRAAALFREIPILPNDIFNSKQKVIEDIKQALSTSRDLRGVFQ